MEVRAPPLPSRYRDPRLAGRGGMADVYRATDTSLGREVAVKVLAERLAEDEELRARFLREGLAGARLSDGPHTIAVYDVGETGGRPFIVMEYVDGGSIAQRLREGPVPRRQALLWLEQAARALDAAHARGVVHRDVKPANLLVDTLGNLRVADFGIARTEGLGSETQTGVVLGTLGYLAPEQAAGGAATPASDQFGLAVVAHELLTGSRPPSDPGRLLPAARAVLARALSERPEERFGSCLGFVDALARALAPDATPAAPPRRRRRRTPTLAAGALATGALAFVLVWGLSARSTPAARHPSPPSGSARVLARRTGPASQRTSTSVGHPAPAPPPRRHGTAGLRGAGRWSHGLGHGTGRHDHGHEDHRPRGGGGDG